MQTSKIILISTSIILITSCAPTQAQTPSPTEQVSETIAPFFTHTSITPIPTKTATNTPAPSPTAIPNYHEMSNEEKLAQSQFFVEKASTYDGDVSFIPVLLDGEAHPEYLSYWSPTAPTQYGLNGNGSWVSSHNTPDSELDKKGDSFPPIAIQGRENPDESLVMIDPDTGAEVIFDKMYVPGIGEVTLQELYAMDKSAFGTQLAEALLESSNVDDKPDHLWPTMLRSAPVNSEYVYISGFKYGKQTNFFADLSGGGSGGVNELPKEGYIYYEQPTNLFAMPIPSPETGKIMLWLNILQGNMTTNITIQYSENPESNSSDFNAPGSRTVNSFGWDGQQDEFGILIANKDSKAAHRTGGAYSILPGGEGIGGATEIESILNATTEQEILDIISQYRIFISNPPMIAFPER